MVSILTNSIDDGRKIIMQGAKLTQAVKIFPAHIYQGLLFKDNYPKISINPESSK